MKLDLVCAEGETVKMADFFKSSSSTVLCTGQLAEMGNYWGGSIQSFEYSSLYTYQMSVIIGYNSPFWLYTVAISFSK